LWFGSALQVIALQAVVQFENFLVKIHSHSHRGFSPVIGAARTVLLNRFNGFSAHRNSHARANR
jgi:hypothetical protein